MLVVEMCVSNIASRITFNTIMLLAGSFGMPAQLGGSGLGMSETSSQFGASPGVARTTTQGMQGSNGVYILQLQFYCL